jgi:uncharacterized protein YceK
MRMFLTLLAVAALAGGCSSHNKKIKSSTHLYNGDSPTIHMQDTQAAGGPMVTY